MPGATQPTGSPHDGAGRRFPEDGRELDRPDEEPDRADAPGPPRPLLLVDIDGVVSLFGFARDAPPAGSFHWIDGIPHFLSAAAAGHLLALSEIFELVWCSGWEERANEYLPSLLGLPARLPYLRFERGAGADGPVGTDGLASGAAGTDGGPAGADGLAGAAGGVGTTTSTLGHWKLAAIDAYAGSRALAWIDDCLDAPCHGWAEARAAPTLLVQTNAAVGITAGHVQELVHWAAARRAA